MANDFYNASGAPSTGSSGASAPIRSEFASLASAFDKMPALAGNANKIVKVNGSGTGLDAGGSVALTGGTIDDAAVNLDAGSLVLPQGTASAPTGEGAIYWNTSTDTLTVGTGSAARVMADVSSAQTLTNKTLTSPVISSISNGGTVTIPSGADTLVTLTAAQTLTNKTLTTPTISSIDNGGTITIPSGGGTFATIAATQTLTNKTLASPAITGTAGFAAGASAAPSIYFGGDTQTGFYRLQANGIAAATAGVLRMQWRASGTTVFGPGASDTGILEVSGAGSYTSAAQFNGMLINIASSIDRSEFNGISSNVNLFGGAVSDVRHLYLGTSIISGGATATRYAGLEVSEFFAPLTASAAYGVRSRVGFGANRYNLYIDGSATNHIAGELLLGTTTGNVATLRVQDLVGVPCVRFDRSSTTASASVGVLTHAATSGDNVFLEFGTESNSSPTFRGSIDYNRGAGALRFVTTSDYRLKDLYGPVAGAVAAIESVPVHRGKMHGATDERPMFVAHELQAIAPYAVTGERDGVNEEGKPVYQQVDHSLITPLLWAAVQELSARVRDLEARLL